MERAKQIIVTIVILSATLFFFGTVFADIGAGAGGWASGGGAVTRVAAYSVCNDVTNYGSTMFVPTGSATEWSYFRSYAPNKALGTCVYRVTTTSVTPSGNYIGTYDDYRGGGVNGQSTQTSLNLICNLAGRSSSTGNYACATNPYAYVCQQADKSGNCISWGYAGYNAESRHNGGWGYYTLGEGYCTDGGVQWVDCYY